jgi:hypothetical protein
MRRRPENLAGHMLHYLGYLRSESVVEARRGIARSERFRSS